MEKQTVDSISESTFWDDENFKDLICPICRCANVHFNQPVLDKGNDNYDADWPGRGDLLTIPMYCEAGCKWDLCFGFHKGTTSTFIRVTTPNEQLKEDYDRYVYFIKAEGLQQIKIGVAKEPEERLKQLKTGSPVKLRLVTTIPGNQEVEKQIHLKFGHLRNNGEWFHATKELMEYIECLH